jgi:outer membrane protein OmpU
MKHTLLASTAFVALTGAAAAEITISGTARIGLRTTEGAAAVTAVAQTYGAITANMESTVEAAVGNATGGATLTGAGTYAATNVATVFNQATATATEIATLDRLILEATRRLAGTTGSQALADVQTVIDGYIDSAVERAVITADIASLNSIRAALLTNTAVTAKAKAADTTVGMNRVRISFAGSGETDGGLTYGFSARADHSNTSNGGSQYISGAFGKISMGDLNGGDEQMVGNLSGVGSNGAGSHQEFAYQSSSHNIGYSVSMAGVSFAATTDLVRGADATKTGSNSAMGVKWSGDMGGATVGLALGASKIGTVSEDSFSASVSMGGLSIKAVSHTNDNGPAVAAVAETAASTAGAGAAARTVYYKAASAAVANADTDTTGLSISYAMDAMSVTAYTRTESTSGVADKDYSGVGFTYNLGGATVKAGFVDADDTSIMDFGINFSF